jgi:anthranilate synthase component 1
MIAKDGLIHIPVGGGIVADSDPAAEYEETMVKAQAMLAAVDVGADELCLE